MKFFLDINKLCIKTLFSNLIVPILYTSYWYFFTLSEIFNLVDHFASIIFIHIYLQNILINRIEILKM